MSVNSRRNTKASAALSRLRVLLVDDERAVVKLLESMLREMGVSQVYGASNGAEALDFLTTCPDVINLVIADWNMPVMSGIQLLQHLRTKDPAMPFVMVTGRATAESVNEAKSLQVTAYVRKPFSQEEVLRKLEAIAATIRPEAPPDEAPTNLHPA